MLAFGELNTRATTRRRLALAAALAGTVSEHSYDHYSLLASIEEMFKLGRLGETHLPGTTTFGRDIFTKAP